MNERVVQFRVGAMVLATLVITGILVTMFGKLPTFKKTYTIEIKFSEAPGVSRDTPVRKSGILIGRVTDHRFGEDGGVIVTARIDSDVVLRQNEICRIDRKLMGDSVLEYVPSGSSKASRESIDPTRLQSGVVALDPLDAMEDYKEVISKAIDSVVQTSNNIGQTADHVNRLLAANEQRINKVVVNADETLSSVKATFENVNKLIGDEKTRQQLSKSVQDMPEMFNETRQVIGRVNDTITLLDRNLRNLEGLTEPLGQKGGDMVVRIDQTLVKLDGVLTEMQKFSQSLSNQDGTLGQLVHNRELYDHLNQTAANVEELTRKLRPIVDDARVFSDKVARHPGVIVRDAIKPGAGTKGVPNSASRDMMLEPAGPQFPLFQRR
jgi:phospholipid/cholesterol/gamma-HCH transport system substrate-binding protein